MLKRIKYIIPALIIFISGCEEVIYLDLNDAGPALVIEADLSSPDGLLTVVVSKTGSYFEPGSVQKINNASVFLENQQGHQQLADAKGEGIYEMDQILAEPGDEFKLTVEVDGIQYTAQSTVKPPVEIDTITYSYYDGDSFFRPGYRFDVSFSDPPEKNYYRIRAFNEVELFSRPEDLVVFDDTDHNGQMITVKMLNQYYLEPGESIVLELLSIDRQAWEYFTTLGNLINAGPGSPAPANPVSCFNNGAQGYFYAWTYSRRLMKIEEGLPTAAGN